MKTHVIILAQGQQKRLPTLTVAKQMIPLPACGNSPIMHRTIRQLHSLLGMVPRSRPDDPIREMVTVVCWLPLSEELSRVGVPIGYDGHRATRYHPDTYTLVEPGNSSLKGVERYLWKTQEERARAGYERTVVLFGDTVYSWACLRAILEGTHWNMGFVGTSDLSTSGGELWGISWHAGNTKPMLDALALANAKHPPFIDYQPGQMRRWLWEIDRQIDGPHAASPDQAVGKHFAPAALAPLEIKRTWYRAIDDYTRDIDIPEHLTQIPDLAVRAREDDEQNGMHWW